MAKYLAGIDEAGRGPVIGPLVMVAAAIEQSDEHALKSFGVKDSKLLTETQREEILRDIEHKLRYELVIISAEEIDDAVLSKNTNLNWLEAEAAATLLNKLDAKLDNEICKAIIDCPSPNISEYKRYVSGRVDNKDIELVLEHKADFNHLIVGAASIIAKVTREKEIEKLKRRYKIDFGSGYPSDPKTKEFLKKYWNDPKLSVLFRKSWAPFKTYVNGKSQKNLGEF